MRSYEEAMEAARPGSPFSNGTSGEIWMGRWCYRCKNDSPEMVDRGEGCPLIMVALMGKTPSEWFEQEGIQDYHCVEFRSEDEGGEATPQPEPIPGQALMFDMDPHARMYADVMAEVRRESVTS